MTYDSEVYKRFYEKHKKRLLENKKSYKSEWYQLNKERIKEKSRIANKLWRLANPHKHNQKEARRRAAKQNGTPSWLSDKQKNQIVLEYELAAWCSDVMKMPYEVDHIIPLKSDFVCGLHVPWNLQVIPMSENRRKGNKL